MRFIGLLSRYNPLPRLRQELDSQAGKNTRQLAVWLFSIAPLYLLAKTLTFLMQAAAARILGPSAFGTVGLVLAVAALISIPVQMGFAIKVSKFVPIAGSFAVERDILSSELLAQVLWGLLFLGLVAAAYPIFPQLFKFAPSVLGWALAYSFALALYTYMTSATAALKLFQARTMADLVYAVSAAVILVVALLGLGTGPFGFVAALIVGLVLSTAFLGVKIRAWLSLRLNTSIVFSRAGYTAAPVVNNLATSLFSSISPVLLAVFLSPREVGIYGVYAMGAVMVSGVLAGLIAIVLFPMAADPARQKGAWNKFLLLGLPLFIGASLTFLLAIYVILRLAGAQYPVSAPLLAIFAVTGALSFLFSIAMTLLGAASERGMWASVITNAAASLVMLISAALLIPSMSVVGAGVSLLVSRAFGFFFSSVVGYRLSRRLA
jgi:O-antigen/teichoic acid export membrane protein